MENYLITSLKIDPFNKGDLRDAIEFGIPHPEIVEALKTGLESKINYWKAQSEGVKDRKTSYIRIMDHVNILVDLATVLQSKGIHTYMEFI